MNKGYHIYEQTHVTTADRGRILLMLYQGAINFLHEAERCMSEGEEVKARVFQGRAFQIIAELMNTLNHEQGGEIAGNLRRMYSFMLHHLSEGNLKKDAQRFSDVARLLTVLHDAFIQAVAIVSHPTSSIARKVPMQAV